MTIHRLKLALDDYLHTLKKKTLGLCNSNTYALARLCENVCASGFTDWLPCLSKTTCFFHYLLSFFIPFLYENFRMSLSKEKAPLMLKELPTNLLFSVLKKVKIIFL